MGLVPLVQETHHMFLEIQEELVKIKTLVLKMLTLA